MMISESNKRFKSALPAPKKEIGADSVNSTAARLNKMSVKERDAGLHDLHGIADLPNETPEMLSSLVEEMNDVLLSPYVDLASNASAYRKAMSMDPDYVEKLKLPCLRASQHNSRQAAALVLRCFEHKLTLFGQERLVKDIKLGDLTDEDREALRKGMAQILPHRDRAGRTVLLALGKVNQEYDIEVVLRVTFYMAMTAIQGDEEDQKRGIVFVYFAFRQKMLQLSRVQRYHTSMDCLPIRWAACHICQEASILNDGGVVSRAFQASKSYIMQAKWLVRVRLHHGSEQECMYNLMTFGIIKEAIPINMDGNIDLRRHHEMLQWLESRDRPVVQTNEASVETSNDDNKSANLLVPGPMDILMGKGRRPTRSSKGTTTFHQLVQEIQPEYDNASKTEKTEIAGRLLKKLNSMGCRFLKETPRGYEECTDSVARSKIAHRFRNHRLHNRAKEGK